MMSYRPLWETMRKKSATTYTLRAKGGVSGSTLLRLQGGQSVSTNTLEALCKILDCTVSEIVEYVADEEK